MFLNSTSSSSHDGDDAAAIPLWRMGANREEAEAEAERRGAAAAATTAEAKRTGLAASSAGAGWLEHLLTERLKRLEEGRKGQQRHGDRQTGAGGSVM